MEFFSLTKRYPASKPAQNGSKGGGEATIPAKPRAERERLEPATAERDRKGPKEQWHIHSLVKCKVTQRQVGTKIKTI